MLPGPQVTVNGKPSCNVRMPPSCQPPSTKSATPPRFISARFLPNGRSHSQEVVQRRRKSKAESPDAAAVVDRFAIRERAEEAHALRKPLLQLEIQRVVVGAAGCGHHLNAAE